MYEIKIVLFDFDGTLVDSMDHYALAASEILSRETPRLTPEQAYSIYRTSSGLSFPEQLQWIVPELSDHHVRINQEFCNRKRDILNRLTLEEATVFSLNSLKERGYGLGGSSNNEIEIIQQFLARQSPSFEFDILLGLTPLMSKGQAHFDYIQSKFNVLDSEILFVGDSLNDAKKAEASKIPFIGIAGTFSEKEFKTAFPTYPVIHAISDLLAYLPPKGSNT